MRGLRVDEPSTNAEKMGYVCLFALNFQYNVRQAIQNSVNVDILMLVIFK